jgi:putative peptidoglycan lipid II flippase
MVKKVAALLHKKNSLAMASAVLMITLTLSNVLGVVRDHFLTQKIPTELLSVYYAAFRIPDLIFNVLILGAITSAFIPIFTNLISREKEDEAWVVASSVINIAFLVLVGFSIILAIFMPWIAPLVVPGFDTAKLDLMVKLARIMLLSPIFFGLSYILGGILNSYKRFLVYSLAPLVYNLAIILGTLFFADKYGIFGVAVAVIIGAFFHFLIQLPVVLRLGFKFKMIIDWKHWGVKRIGLLMIPRALALGANQIMLLVFTSISSSLGQYSIAAYNLADNI